MYDDDLEGRRRLAATVHAEAIAAMSLTRDGTLEITSARQLRIVEQAAERILSLHIEDAELNQSAMEMRAEARAARRWIWVNQPAAAALLVVAVAIGLGAAAFGGLVGNVAIVVTGVLVSSGLLATVVLRHRRENWRIRADEIAPLIWKPGI